MKKYRITVSEDTFLALKKLRGVEYDDFGGMHRHSMNRAIRNLLEISSRLALLFKEFFDYYEKRSDD